MRGAIPAAPLTLGLAGTIPFIWGAATLWSDSLGAMGLSLFGARFIGPFVQLGYGMIILAFMSGVLWGFATRADPQIAPTAYGLSVVPALWIFFFMGDGPVSSAVYLITGFIGLLGLDWLFWKQDLTPHWWLRLRILLTAIVVLSLAATVVALGA